MWPNPQFPGDLVTFTKETLNRKLHFFCALVYAKIVRGWKLFSIFLKKFRDKCFTGPSIPLLGNDSVYPYMNVLKI